MVLAPTVENHALSSTRLGLAIADVFLATIGAGGVLTRPTGNLGTYYSQSQLELAMAITDALIANGVGPSNGGGGTIGDLDAIAASRLIGNPTASSAAPSEIPLGNPLYFNGTFLDVKSGGIASANIANLAVQTGKIADRAVTFAKMQTITNNRFLANSSGVAAVPSEHGLGAGLTFSGGDLRLVNNGITFSKLEQVAANTLVGNPTGSTDDIGEIDIGGLLSFVGTDLIAATETAIFSDTKAASTNGGSAAAGTQTRDLNTTEQSQSWASLASNQITLNAGDYLVEWSAPAFAVNAHQTSLYNVSDSAVEEYGESNYSANSSTIAATNSPGSCVLAIASSKIFEIRHYTQTAKSGNGLGSGNSANSNIYTRVSISRLT